MESRRLRHCKGAYTCLAHAVVVGPKLRRFLLASWRRCGRRRHASEDWPRPCAIQGSERRLVCPSSNVQTGDESTRRDDRQGFEGWRRCTKRNGNAEAENE